MQPTIETTERLVRSLFRGHVDLAGLPMVDHAFRVRAGFKRMWRRPWNENDIHAVLMHDVLEDTELRKDDLISFGYSDRVVWLVDRLSNSTNAPYLDYIAAICATGDRSLITIKAADNEDNRDERRLRKLEPKQQKWARERYGSARVLLDKAIAAFKVPA